MLGSEMKTKKTSPGVYKLMIGDYFYIGSAKNLSARMSHHKQYLRKNIHSNWKVQMHWDQIKSIKFEVLVYCPEEECLTHEQAYLDKHHTDVKCLNIAPFAGSSRGVTRTIEHKAAIGAAAKGNTYRKGTIQSEETRAAISRAKKGKPGPGKGRGPSGERAGMSKLKNDQIRMVRELYRSNKYSKGNPKGYTHQQLADMINITRENVTAILNNKTWKHI
jgi:group I intron endonuclease